MSFLGGLVSSIFGGGSTKVTQTATNETKVDVGVDVTNAIDLGGLADVLQQFGADTQTLVSKLGTDTNTLLQAMLETDQQDQKVRQAQVLVALNGQAIEQDRTTLLRQYGKTALLLGGAYVAYKMVIK